MLLSLLKPGETAKIVDYLAEPPHLAQLQCLGLVPGTVVSILRVAPFGDPIQIKVRDYDLCLRRKDLDYINVTQIL